VRWSTVVVGSEAVLFEALVAAADADNFAGSDVVLVPTAAAFTGATEASLRVAAVLEPFGARVEALMVIDRDSANEAYFATRIEQADLVVLLDGSALHARSVWRASAFGEALARAGTLVAVGAVATVIGEEMIDPRGGAPTTGLAIRRGAVLTTPASAEQLERTRGLIDASELLVVLEPNGAVVEANGQWVQLLDHGVTASRAVVQVTLARPSSQ